MPRSEIEGLLQMMRSAPPAQSIADLRATIDLAIPLLNASLPEVAAAHAAVPIGSDDVRADVLVPPGVPPFPVLIYLHGGGWSIGSPATHAQLARVLAVGAGALVVNVDYRLAPEHPFPIPFEDCVAAARWTHDRIARFGGDPSRLAIGGDSAGANLAAATINALRDTMGFCAALLIYGAFDLRASRRDYDRYAPEEDPVLPKHAMDLMLAAYLSGGADIDDPRVSPLKANLHGFPPSCLLCGTWDPLLGESQQMHAALQRAGVASELHTYPEMPHAFLQLGSTDAGMAVETACAFLRRRLGAGASR